MAPWSTYWDRNFFTESVPALEQWLASPFAKGAVSGVGVVTVCAGIADLTAAFASRRRPASRPAEPPLPFDH